MLYILHFSQPIGNPLKAKGMAQHYTGCCADDRFLQRLLEHQHGFGSAITRHAVQRGISLLVGNTLPGGYDEERLLKRSTKNAPRYCVYCKQQRILEKMFKGGDDATA